MPAESRNLPEQERSIKAREHELYFKPQSPKGAASKTFEEYLRETPAEALSTATKTMLWIVALLVAIAFMAAIWRVIQRRSTRPRNHAAPEAAQAVAQADHRRLAIAKALGYVV